MSTRIYARTHQYDESHNEKYFFQKRPYLFLVQMSGQGVGREGAGAGHGGQGGISKTKRGGGLYYDSVTQPALPGSGALNNIGALKARGGGALKFEVTSIMHVDGELVAMVIVST